MIKTGIVQEKIYVKLDKLGILQVKESVHLKSGSFMDLVVERLGENHFSLTHYYEQNGDLCPDPDMEIRIMPDMEMAEALSYQDSFGFRKVYYPDNMVDLKAKKDLNQFLNTWLNNLKKQGFKYPNGGA